MKPPKTPRFYYTTDFEGKCPVGTSAIVVAAHRPQARLLLRTAIVEAGLEDPGEHLKVTELVCGAVVLQDGNY